MVQDRCDGAIPRLEVSSKHSVENLPPAPRLHVVAHIIIRSRIERVQASLRQRLRRIEELAKSDGVADQPVREPCERFTALAWANGTLEVADGFLLEDKVEETELEVDFLAGFFLCGDPEEPVVAVLVEVIHVRDFVHLFDAAGFGLFDCSVEALFPSGLCFNLAGKSGAHVNSSSRVESGKLTRRQLVPIALLEGEEHVGGTSWNRRGDGKTLILQ